MASGNVIWAKYFEGREMLLHQKSKRSSTTDTGHRFILRKLHWFLMKGDFFLSHISVKNEIVQKALTSLWIIHCLVTACRGSLINPKCNHPVLPLRAHIKVTQELDRDWQSLVLLCSFNTTSRKREKEKKMQYEI